MGVHRLKYAKVRRLDSKIIALFLGVATKTRKISYRRMTFPKLCLSSREIAKREKVMEFHGARC